MRIMKTFFLHYLQIMCPNVQNFRILTIRNINFRCFFFCLRGSFATFAQNCSRNHKLKVLQLNGHVIYSRKLQIDRSLLHYLGTVSIFLPLREDNVVHYNLGENRIAIWNEFCLAIHKFECTYTFHILLDAVSQHG